MKSGYLTHVFHKRFLRNKLISPRKPLLSCPLQLFLNAVTVFFLPEDAILPNFLAFIPALFTLALSFSVSSTFDSTHCNPFQACCTSSLLASWYLHMVSVPNSIISGIQTAEIYQATKQEMECFPFLAFHTRYLRSKNDAVCIRALDSWEVQAFDTILVV